LVQRQYGSYCGLLYTDVGSPAATAQGFADESTRSRGQAWTLYSFTLIYRETGDARFLQAARMTADYFIKHLPSETSSRRVSQTVADSMHGGPALEEGRVRHRAALAVLAHGTGRLPAAPRSGIAPFRLYWRTVEGQ